MPALPLLSSYVGPFVAAAPELVEENGKNKEEGRGRKKKSRMEKRGPRRWRCRK